MTDLERALLELDVEWPPTPDIAGAVRERIVVRSRPMRRRLAWVAAALAVALGGVAVVPAARSAVLEWLGLKSVEIHRGPVPTGTPDATLELGEKVTLAQARARTPVLVPRSLGTPSGVYLARLQGGPEAATLLYPHSVLVQTFKARATPFIRKTVGSARAVKPLRVDGARAYWLIGAHGFIYSTPGNAAYEPQRIAGNTLLVEKDGLLLRVEGALTEARATAIARDALS